MTWIFDAEQEMRWPFRSLRSPGLIFSSGRWVALPYYFEVHHCRLAFSYLYREIDQFLFCFNSSNLINFIICTFNLFKIHSSPELHRHIRWIYNLLFDLMDWNCIITYVHLYASLHWMSRFWRIWSWWWKTPDNGMQQQVQQWRHCMHGSDVLHLKGLLCAFGHVGCLFTHRTGNIWSITLCMAAQSRWYDDSIAVYSLFKHICCRLWARRRSTCTCRGTEDQHHRVVTLSF